MRKIKDKCLEHKELLFQLVEDEHGKQLAKWGVQECSPFEWLAYVTKKLGELSGNMSEVEYQGNEKHTVVHTSIQVATLALKVAEMYMENLPEEQPAECSG